MNRLGRDRYSIPFFYAPRPDARVACLEPFRQGGQEKYPPILVKDYLAMKFESITRPVVAAGTAGAGGGAEIGDGKCD